MTIRAGFLFKNELEKSLIYNKEIPKLSKKLSNEQKKKEKENIKKQKENKENERIKIINNIHNKISNFLKKNNKPKYNKRKNELNKYIDEKLGIIKKIKNKKTDGLIRYGNKIIIYKHNKKLFSRYDFFISIKSKNNPEKLADGVNDILKNNMGFFNDFFNIKKNNITNFTEKTCEACNRHKDECGQIDKAHEEDRPGLALITAKKLLQNYNKIHMKHFLMCFMYEHKNHCLWNLCHNNCHKYLDKGISSNKRYNIKHHKAKRTKSVSRK